MKKFLKCFVGLFLFTVLINSSADAQQLYRSIASGNWNANSTWEYSTNGGANWLPATTTPNSGNNSGTTVTHIVTVTANVTSAQLILNGTISINAGIVFTYLYNFTLNSVSSIIGAGTFQIQAVQLIIKTGSLFSATLKVSSGTTTSVFENSSPYIAKLSGNVIVDAGATLNTANSSLYTLYIYGNLTNNGAITGNGSSLKFFGAALSNTGSIAPSKFTFDSTCTVSGNGTYTSSYIFIGPNGNVTLSNDVTFSPVSEFEIKTGGIFSANSYIFTFNSGRFTVLTGGTVVNSGTIRTQNSISINARTGSNFNANVNVISGTTVVEEVSSPFTARLRGNVTVNSGATLNTGNSSLYTTHIYGNLTNNGAITGNGSSLKFFGAALSNTGSIAPYQFTFDSTCTVSGSGSSTSTYIIIGPTGNVTLLSDVTFSPLIEFEIKTGGIFSANSNALTMTSGRFSVLTGGTVVNSGTIRTQNSISINARTGSNFNANVNVISGTTVVEEVSSPFTARLRGNVTVNSGATLNTGNSSLYTTHIYGNLTNNGAITGNGSSLKFFGAALSNTGSIAPYQFTFDSTCTVSGNGTYTSSYIFIGLDNNVTLSNDVTFSPVTEFEIKTGGIFSSNSYIFTFNSGRFTVLTGGSVVNSGIVRTQNNVSINPRTGSSFNANLNVASGITIASEVASPFTAKLYGNITIDAGATLSCNNSSLYKLFIFGNITNNGTISGTSYLEFQNGAHTLQGIGKWTTTAYILNGATVNLTSNHQFSDININSGGTFVTGSNTAKFTETNPIIQNGTLTGVGGKIEYNGTTLQNISATNITYYGLRINNTEGTVLLGNVSVNDTLSVTLGDLDLNGKIITVSSTGYLTETPDNTVKGNTGYITTTRNVGTPSSLNVGGFGAVLTAASNLGSTEIRRGHTVQTGGSIRRYFDITPANNTGLTATLKFKYDDSELNLRPEMILKLLKSINGGASWTLMGGTVNTFLNEITLSGITSFSRWTADSSGTSAVVNMAIEGFYNPSTNRLRMQDTIRIYLRNTLSPFAIVDSAKTILDSVTLKAACVFVNATNGIYYIQTKHRNSIETWSRAGGETYTVGTTLNYDFTSSAPKAFGNNQVQVDASPLRFAIYSGDILQDGIVDGSDAGIADNDAANFVTGYVASDVNGDRFVDGSDGAIVDNNAFNFISVARP